MHLTKIAIIAVLMTSSAWADCCGLQIRTRWGGGPIAAGIAGDLAVIQAGTELSIVRVVPGDSMPAISQTPMRPLRSFVLSGDLLFAEQDQSLLVLSLADPAHPAQLARVPLESLFSVSSAIGDRLYINETPSGGFARVRVFDISEPASPTPIGTIEEAAQNVRLLKIDGGRGYLAVNDRALRAIDLTEPTLRILWTVDLRRYLSDVMAINGYLYVALGYSGYVVVDTHDDVAPVVVHSGADSTERFLVGPSNTVISVFNNGVSVLSNAVPEMPILVGWTIIPGVLHVSQLGDQFVTIGARGIDLLDLSNPQNIRVRGSFRDVGVATAFATHDGIGYAGGWRPGDIVRVLDMTSARPRVIGAVPVPLPSQFNTNKLAVIDDQLWIAGDSGVFVADISNPAVPGLAVRVANAATSDFVIADGYLFSVGSNDLRIYQLTDAPLGAVQVGRVAGIGSRSIVLFDSFAYVGGGYDNSGARQPSSTYTILRLPYSCDRCAFRRFTTSKLTAPQAMPPPAAICRCWISRTRRSRS